MEEDQRAFNKLALYRLAVASLNSASRCFSTRSLIRGNCNVCVVQLWQGQARTQAPTRKNDDVELPTFGVILGVSPTEVQWKSLALGERPS